MLFRSVSQSRYQWFLIGYEGIVFAFTIVFFGLCVLNGGYTFTCRIENILSILTYLVLRLYIADHSSIASILGVFLRTFVVGIVILLPDNQKELILNFFTKWFSIIILVSLIGWILVKIGLKLPYGYCSFGDTVDSHKNYFIFLEINNTLFMQDWRFMSIFSEPGYLAMISCLLLFINGFDFRDRSVLVIFLGGVLASFSFAGYALFIVGLIVTGKQIGRAHV